MIFKVSSFIVEEEPYQKANPSPVNEVLGVSFPCYKLSTGCSRGWHFSWAFLGWTFHMTLRKGLVSLFAPRSWPCRGGLWKENVTADSEPWAAVLWWSRDHLRFFLCFTTSRMPGSVTVHHVVFLQQRRPAACSGCVATSGLKLVCSGVGLLFSLLIMKQKGKLGLQLLARRTALESVNPSVRSDLRELGQSCIC